MNGTSNGERQQTRQDEELQNADESCHDDDDDGDYVKGDGDAAAADDTEELRRRNRIDLRRVKWSLIRKARVCAIIVCFPLLFSFVTSDGGGCGLGVFSTTRPLLG